MVYRSIFQDAIDSIDTLPDDGDRRLAPTVSRTLRVASGSPRIDGIERQGVQKAAFGSDGRSAMMSGSRHSVTVRVTGTEGTRIIINGV